jgi:hypothetical protein
LTPEDGLYTRTLLLELLEVLGKIWHEYHVVYGAGFQYLVSFTRKSKISAVLAL